ncbi:MAG: hypothetical protein K2X93_16845 [Candidatus Obscuribacterales bacterium]|nr:hypothetical protein [Candidatus Obscuribacterales bacterium]
MKRIGSNGYVLGSSHCLLEGCFDRPATILSHVRATLPVKQGVVEITSPKLSGRIGVLGNSSISGAIVDGTGETGIGAVYKLLLVPAGRYLFRFPQKTETWELNQDLSMETSELEQLLVGPSNIGLSRPSQTFTTPSLEWDERANHASMYIKDCHLLLSAMIADKQRAMDLTKRQGAPDVMKRQSASDMAKLQGSSASLCHSVKNERRISPAARMCVLFVSLALGSFLLVPSGAWSKVSIFPGRTSNQQQRGELRTRRSIPYILPAGSSEPLSGGRSSNNSTVSGFANLKSGSCANGVVKRSAPSIAIVASTGAYSPALSVGTQSAGSSASSSNVRQPASANSSSYSSGTPAYYAAESEGAISGNESTDEISEFALPSQTPRSYSVGSTPSNVQEGDASRLLKNARLEHNVSFWVKRVRFNPNDAVARKYLAYSLLYSGNPQASVQQFQALMTIRPLDIFEEQSYRDAMVLSSVLIR